MYKIVFVGDKPSKYNKDPKVPFVGTKSYKTLLSWIADMNIDIRQVELDNASTFRNWNYNRYDEKYKFIALGKIACKKLWHMDREYFELPHPSGLNRKINDKKELKKILKECEVWLNIE